MHNLKSAIRSLLATPGSTLVILATLAIAIGANAAIFSVIDGVLLRPLGYGQDDRLVVVWGTNRSGGPETFRLSPADYRDLRDGVEAFRGQVALYRSIGSTLTAVEPPVRIGSLSVTPRLFSVLGVNAAVGRLYDDADEKPGGGNRVLLTHSAWTHRFGADPSIVGSTIELDSEAYTVVGVTEPGFRFPVASDRVEVYFPMALSDAVLLDRSHRMFDAIARLADGVGVKAANAELAANAERLAREFPDSNAGWGLVARPLREELLGDLGTTLWVLWGAVFVVLLVACTNVSNLLVARSTAAGRELAVRSAIGARPRDLAWRSLVESSILGVLGGAFGVALAFGGVALLRSLMPASIPRLSAIEVDGAVLLLAAGLTVGSTVLFGLLPAWRSMVPDVLEPLKSASPSSRSARGGRRLREALVVVEVALAFVLVVTAGLMVRSFARLGAVDPGFRKEGVVAVAVQLPRARYGRAEWGPFFERLVERVERLPGVEGVGAVSDLPMSEVGLGFELEFTVPGLDSVAPTARPNAEVRLVVPGYFEAMEIEVVSGRSFDALEATREGSVAIVNQTVVDRYFRGVDPIGRSLGIAMLGDVEVVGVVADIRHGGLQSEHDSEVYLPYGQISTAEMHLVVRSDLPTEAVASSVREVLAELDSKLAPTQVVAISDLLWQSVAQPRFNTALLASLAVCAALLAAVGTYGIVAYTVSQRAGEIGVRMALGAGAGSTVAMIVRQALGIVIAGAFLGLLGSAIASRFLGSLLFEVEPTDPLTYGLAVAAAVLVGVLAAWLPARRAARIDPVAALREG